MVKHCKALISLTFGALLSGCIYAPKEVTYLDEGCDIEYKKMELDAQQLVKMEECKDEDCALIMLAGVFLSPASAIVSGSIVVVNNSIHWMEKSGDCVKEEVEGEADEASAEQHSGH